MKIQVLHVNLDHTATERVLPSAQLVIAIDPAGRARIIKNEVEAEIHNPYEWEELPPYKFTGDHAALLKRVYDDPKGV